MKISRLNDNPITYRGFNGEAYSPSLVIGNTIRFGVQPFSAFASEDGLIYYIIPVNRITPHQAYAELDHAQSYNVNPKDACDIITDLHASGTNFEGESEVLNGDTRLGIPGTPNGDILAAILMHGGKIGKSTRGAVDNPKNPIIDRNNTYKLITVDTVLNPSRTRMLY